MQLITTKHFQVMDASQQMVDGSYPDVSIPPGAYDLEEIPNPLPKPPHIDEKHWSSTWLVVRGTKRGMSRGAFEHNYKHHRDPSVTLLG